MNHPSTHLAQTLMKTGTLFLLSLAALGNLGLLPSLSAQEGSKRVFRSVDEILNVVPATIVVKSGEGLNMAAVQQANQALERFAETKTAELRSRIEHIEESKTKGYPPGFIAYGPKVKLRRGSESVTVQVSVYFNAVDAKMAAALKPNSEVTATGTVRCAEFRVGKKREVTLVIDLTGSKVK